jgi:hypothetical protein
MRREGLRNADGILESHGQLLIHNLPQLIIEETEGLLEKWKHPDPYRAPTAPGGSKYERNLPVPSTERKFLASRLAKTSNILSRI